MPQGIPLDVANVAAATEARDIAAGNAPSGFYDAIADRVAKNEAAMRAWFAELDVARRLPREAQPSALPQWNREYISAFQQHNEHKFFCFLIPALRARLKGRVKVPDISVLRASSALVANFIVESNLTRDKLLALQREGYITGFSGFGAEPVSTTVIAAVAIAAATVLTAAILSGIWYLGQLSEERRDATRQNTLQAITSCVNAGKCRPEQLQQAVQSYESIRRDELEKGGLTRNIVSILTWGLVAFLVVQLTPPLLGAFERRRSAEA